MTQHATGQEARQENTAAPRPVPAFKPVALPALAAAVQAARSQPNRQKTIELPAILRKEAMLG